MTETIPHLNIEILPSGVVRLENESMGDSYAVDIHPVHLRHLAEQLGLIREVAASDADMLRALRAEIADLQAQRKRLHHAMTYCQWYADILHKNIAIVAGHGREDLTTELCDALALVNFCDYVCDAEVCEGGDPHAAPARHSEAPSTSPAASDGATFPSSTPASPWRPQVTSSPARGTTPQLSLDDHP